ncbi:GDSL-type esterase/lipase family protein [Flavobacterium sp.]|uniref:GDSL-type esterase/lipase family protein n=1 Tax=Flavobacterium sp. TaxID=239 RepID=UPI003751675B
MKNDWSNLKKYAIQNEALLDSENSKRIVFIGDSITEFWKNYDIELFKTNFVNRGISGQTTKEILHRFTQDVLNLKPKIVVILAGVNDIAENFGAISNQNIFENIVSMIDMAKSSKIEVILCSILPANKFSWKPKITPAEKIIELNKMLKLYSEVNRITYVDYYNTMIDNEKGLNKKYSDDGVHPNNEGYKIMKPLVIEVISKLL